MVRDEDYGHVHPSTALLVVEVARTGLDADLQVKPALYAAAGVAGYRVVDPGERVVHVHRQPGAGGYADVTVQREGVVRSAMDPSFALDPQAVLPT